jgi:hypothetical protein
MTAQHDLPTADWEHSHALEAGDELVDNHEGTPITVQAVNDDGSVDVRCWLDERHGQEYVDETWAEEGATAGLTRNDIKTAEGGLSHQLASY